ncbi:MAG: uracil-DNA glycosylase [Verrucomicrobiota bacterium]
MPNTAQMSEAIHTLTEILQHQKDLGDDKILLQENDLATLRNLPQQFRQQFTPRPAITAAASSIVNAPTQSQGPATTESRPNTPPPASTETTPPNKRNQLNTLAREVKSDETYRSLGTLGTTMVFASGNPDARLMLIGEAPGLEEEQDKKPFRGAAGELLDNILKAMKLTREEIYISNVLKFRPLPSNQQDAAASNRRPNKDEINASIKYILAEIDVVKPAVIIALGGTAAHSLLETNAPLKDLRQQEHHLKGIPVIVSYHPAYLIHCESTSADKYKKEKGKVWLDMKLALQKLENSARG